MHTVFGLKQLGLTFELKGGTSLSKGFGIIERFSEDIDIRIEPFDGLQVDTNPNHDKPKHIESRRMFYEKLRDKVKISGITAVERDTTYDDETLRNAGLTVANLLASIIARSRCAAGQSSTTRIVGSGLAPP